MADKKCSQCGRVKDLTAYAVKKQAKDGRQDTCRVCKSKVNALYRNKHKVEARDAQLRIKYNISVEEYNKMFILQHGCCAICNNPETIRREDGKLQWLVVDHNHTTGEVRGLLCSNCNTGIGLLGDHPKTLDKAGKYLKKRGYYGIR